MRLANAIAEIRAIKPNQYDDATLTAWISELDGQLHDTVLRGRVCAPPARGPYNAQEDGDTVLLALFPYDQMYLAWLSAKIDFSNQEFDRYNNAMMLYNAYHESFAASYAREHPSASRGWIRV